MHISVAEDEKRNGSIVGSVLPIYTRPRPVQVRTWTFPQVDPHRTWYVDPHRTGSRRSLVKARPIWTQSGTGPKFISSRVNGALNSHTQKVIYSFSFKFAHLGKTITERKKKNSDCSGERLSGQDHFKPPL